ncbi:RNA polymerase sigma factor [Candidatus Roizmanbacteria bacterium]|nr:RNA polymerase sigma factor [Candidatus Roizmanbacteria bacterium]
MTMETVLPTDEEIIINIRQGKIDLYSYIVKKYTPRILQFISSRLFDKLEAEDLTQNVFINFYKGIGRFDEKKPLLPYLYESARNELKMFYRSHKEVLSLDEQIMVDEQSTKETNLIDIDEVLKDISGDQKKALKLISEGYSYQEIADKMKKNINTVRTLIRRARLLLNSKKTYEKA